MSLKIHIWMMFFISFLGNFMFSLTTPSIALYINEIQGNDQGSTVLVGWAIGIYCLAAAIAGPIFGYWYQKTSFTIPLATCLFLEVVGNLLYILARNFGGVKVILISRAIIGVGASSIGLARSYLAVVVEKSEMDHYMLLFTVSQTLGIIFGPLFGLISAFVNFKIGSVVLDQYTLPPVLVMLPIIVLLASLIKFKDKTSIVVESKFTNSPTNKVGVLIVFFQTFVIGFGFSGLETILVPLTLKMYGWGVKENGGLLAGLAAVSVLGYIGYLVLRKLFTSYMISHVRHNYVITMCLLAMGNLLLINFGTPKLPLAQLLVALIPYCVGFALAQPLNITIFNQLMPPNSKQAATMMGWQTGMYGLARFAGPLVLSALADVNPGPDNGRYGMYSAIFTCILTILGILLMLVKWKSLQPYKAPEDIRHTEIPV